MTPKTNKKIFLIGFLNPNVIVDCGYVHECFHASTVEHGLPQLRGWVRPAPTERPRAPYLSPPNTFLFERAIKHGA